MVRCLPLYKVLSFVANVTLLFRAVEGQGSVNLVLCIACLVFTVAYIYLKVCYVVHGRCSRLYTVLFNVTFAIFACGDGSRFPPDFAVDCVGCLRKCITNLNTVLCNLTGVFLRWLGVVCRCKYGGLYQGGVPAYSGRTKCSGGCGLLEEVY